MRLILLFINCIVLGFSSAQVSWTRLERLVAGCSSVNILDCVASFEGKMCVNGDIPFKRDCFECKCNAYGYWKCRNYCVRSWEGQDQTISLDALQNQYTVAGVPISVYDYCIPGQRFLKEVNSCTICTCSPAGKKSLSPKCYPKWWCTP